ncbi:hypothetical protein EOD41_20160 [Mucilaginibacter limnophilus]|uniref:Uncharacterized protein n=1 Tax=Mucilaginibacter limnophilus TaxID=1932778 RepID=A0A3S2V5N2_9SPHI|nr:hypothetical protein [Mucilaginibacter limnophilus]RVT96485.1 hypothetical protein EOD41_20160 [Mucilaginibacter limnophilus]
MSFPALVFWAIFVIPLIVFLIWVMKQDKRKGKTGLIILAILVIGVIIYMYSKHMFDSETLMTR